MVAGPFRLSTGFTTKLEKAKNFLEATKQWWMTSGMKKQKESTREIEVNFIHYSFWRIEQIPEQFCDGLWLCLLIFCADTSFADIRKTFFYASRFCSAFARESAARRNWTSWRFWLVLIGSNLWLAMIWKSTAVRVSCKKHCKLISKGTVTRNQPLEQRLLRYVSRQPSKRRWHSLDLPGGATIWLNLFVSSPCQHSCSFANIC